MRFKTRYLLIFDGYYYHLYKSYGKNICQLITTEIHYDAIIKKFTQLTIKNVVIFDDTFHQILKIEKAPSSLNIKEYIQWYWKKRSLFLHQVEFGLTRAIIRLRTILMAGIAESSLLNEFLTLLHKNQISFTCVSYTLSLGVAIRKKLTSIHPNITHPLIIIVDESMRMTFLFFEKSELSFTRNYLPSLQQPIAQQLKNSILDTVKYLEKTMTEKKISLIFYLAAPMKDLENMFSQDLFFYEDKLSSPKEAPSFRDIVLTQPFWPYQLCPCGQAWGSQYSIVHGLSRFIQWSSLLLFLCAFYFAYHSIHLMQKMKKSSQKISSFQNQSIKLHQKLASIPFSSQQISLIQEILKKSNTQYKKLWQFLDLISHIFNNKYVLQELLIKQKKSRLTIQPLDSTDKESFEDFIDIWQQNIPEIRLILLPQESNSSFTIETDSPFQTIQ